MSLSFTNTIDKGVRTWKDQGVITTEIEMTTTTGSGGADYSSGFDLKGNASKLGFRKIFRVYGATVVNGSGTTVLTLKEVWDHQSGKLRFVVMSTGLEDAATITANSKVRFVVIGV